jgi:hypothetical protein
MRRRASFFSLLMAAGALTACGGAVATQAPAQASSDGGTDSSAGTGGTGGTGGGGGWAGQGATAGTAGTGGTAGAAGTGGAAATGGGGTGGGTGGGPSFAACSGPGECILAEPGCCGSCGVVPLSKFDAINKSAEQAHHAATCTDPSQPCPGCMSRPDPNAFAYCPSKSCVGADIRTHAWSACQTDADCILRVGTACCEKCFVEHSDEVVALASKHAAEFRAAVCAPSTGCPTCLPQYPPGSTAWCNPSTKHCEALVPKDGG